MIKALRLENTVHRLYCEIGGRDCFVSLNCKRKINEQKNEVSNNFGRKTLWFNSEAHPQTTLLLEYPRPLPIRKTYNPHRA